MSNFHSSFSMATKNCLMPSRVNSSLRKTRILSIDYFSLSYEFEVMIPFDKDADGISHKFSCHLQNFMWQGSAHQYHLMLSVLKQMNGPRKKFRKITTKCADLAVWWEVAVDVVDLLLESCSEEFLSRSIIMMFL